MLLIKWHWDEPIHSSIYYNLKPGYKGQNRQILPCNQPPMNTPRTMLFDRSCYKLTLRCNEHEIINTRGIQLILYLIRPAESEEALSNGYSRHRRHYVLFLYRWVGVCVCPMPLPKYMEKTGILRIIMSSRQYNQTQSIVYPITGYVVAMI